ncbi:MAG: hypothetical protein HOC71_04315 [Candidatus Latescibacteria bacterium]|jgi:hypothetical protein|nr:hypothetical protein [Candidatus Latescibacterota bacterium]
MKTVKFFKLICFSALLLLPIITVIALPEKPEEDDERFIGAWVRHDFYYDFDNSGVMKAVKVNGEPKGYRTFKYTFEKMGLFKVIRFGKSISDSTGLNFLLVGNVTDSTAIISHGTPFVRADSSSGLSGTWKYVNNYKTIIITIDQNTIDYREMVMDLKTGATNTTEQRQGNIKYRNGKYSGQFIINFFDGTKTTVVPVLFNKIMYFYDLSPIKSMFIRAEQVPTYREYQKVSKN